MTSLKGLRGRLQILKIQKIPLGQYSAHHHPKSTQGIKAKFRKVAWIRVLYVWELTKDCRHDRIFIHICGPALKT